MACSLEQTVPKSKLLPATIFAMASSRSADLSTSTGTLPGPTPNAGLPLEYADLTIAWPPVARITAVRSWRISAWMPSMVQRSMHWMMSSGAPASSAAWYMMAAVSQVQRCARGCGLITMALPALSEISVLYIAVDVGLV